MPANTDAQRRRRKDAIFSAGVYTALLILFSAILLALKIQLELPSVIEAILLISALLDLGMIVPIWILVKQRLKEIQGGEEDAAAQY